MRQLSKLNYKEEEDHPRRDGTQELFHLWQSMGESCDLHKKADKKIPTQIVHEFLKAKSSFRTVRKLRQKRSLYSA